MSKHFAAVLCMAALCAVGGDRSADAQLVRAGSEFQVNTYTSGGQNGPAIGVDGDGDFVVAWNRAHEGGLGLYDIVAARFNSSGALQGAEFVVNTYTTSIQRHPSVAVESNGDFVIVWQSIGQVAGPLNYAVFGQRFSSNATPLGVEFKISANTDYATYPKVASDPDGDFVVVWDGPDGYLSFGVQARRFSSAGTGLATEFRVNTFTVSQQERAAVALDADGDFVITWESFFQDQNAFGIFAQRYSSDGTEQAIEFQVNSRTSSDQAQPAIAAQADGDFVIAWQGRNQDGADYGIFARRFTSAGTAQASELQVNAFTAGYQLAPGAAAGAAGDFLVTWVSQNQDGAAAGLFARRVSSVGGAFGPDFQVNTWTSNRQIGRAIDSDGSGGFLVAWQNEDPQDGDFHGVFAQRVTAPSYAILDVDASGGLVNALTDGLLVLRFAFGFTGTTLTNGATGANCARCTGAEIELYLAGLSSLLDVDDNGTVDALTDGLIVVRYMFGFSGTTLTNGAVANDCGTRCDASAIVAYLQSLD